MEKKLQTFVETLFKNEQEPTQIKVKSKSMEMLRKLTGKSDIPVETAIALACIQMPKTCTLDYDVLSKISNVKYDRLRKEIISQSKRLQIQLPSISIGQLAIIFNTGDHIVQLAEKLLSIIRSSSSSAAPDTNIPVMAAFFLTLKSLSMRSCKKEKLISLALVTNQVFESAIFHLQKQQSVSSYLEDLKNNASSLRNASTLKRNGSKKKRFRGSDTEEDNDDYENACVHPVDGISSMLQRQDWKVSQKYQAYCDWKAEFIKKYFPDRKLSAPAIDDYKSTVRTLVPKSTFAPFN